MPSAVDHLLVRKKKHPLDGKVIPQMVQGLGSRTQSRQLAWELEDVRNPLLDSLSFPKKVQIWGGKEEILHYRRYNPMRIKLEFDFSPLNQSIRLRGEDIFVLKQ